MRCDFVLELVPTLVAVEGQQRLGSHWSDLTRGVWSHEGYYLRFKAGLRE